MADSYQVLYGHPDKPHDEWEIYRMNLTDPPEYIQEYYIRRPNWEEAYFAKLDKRDPKTIRRYVMRKTPPDQDYVARFAAREDYVRFMERDLPRHYMAELIEGKVFFYDTESDALKDKRSNLPFKRFLRTKLYMGEWQVADKCREYNIPYADGCELKFAETEEDILRVYRLGPRSCMAGDSKHEQEQLRAYAKKPIAVAYVTCKDGDEEEIIARVICNTKRKQYISSAYGDCDKITALLREAGYTCNSNALNECELNPVSYREYGWPYFDFRYSRVRTKRSLKDLSTRYFIEGY